MLVETEYDAVRQLGDLMSRSHIDFMVDHPLFFAGKIKQVASSD